MSQRQSRFSVGSQVAGAAGLERLQEPRRLVVVILLPTDRQGVGRVSPDTSENAKSISRSLPNIGMKHARRRCRIELRGSDGNADVVALDVEVHQLQRVDLVQRNEAVMGKRPPVRAVLEHVRAEAAAARDRQQRRPLVDGRAGIVGLHELRPASRRGRIARRRARSAMPCPIEAREDAPFAFGPLREVAIGRRREALGVAAALARVRRFAEHFDVRAGLHLQAAATEYVIDLLWESCGHLLPSRAAMAAR